MISRRSLLKSSALLLLSGLRPAMARVSFKSYPFKLGVASGSPEKQSLVLWTRLAPEPLLGGGLDPEPINVNWEIALNESFSKIIKSGSTKASPAYAHSVHVAVDGLEPSKTYYYRFHAGDAVSPTGQTRTAQSADALEPVKFTYASCQMYEQGYFTAHRHMADEDLDFVIFLGDYIYERSWGNNDVRKHEGDEVYTLAQYRNRYACYKSDADLQLCHSRFPWIVTWDDHEVDNDYANDRAEDLEQNFLTRRGAAYQAFFEHMPLHPSMAPHLSDMRIYQAFDFGGMARFHVLDDRQYRDYQVCPKPNRGGGNYVYDCPERNDEKRTLLGFQQEKWLAESLKSSAASWDIIVQQTLMTEVKREGGKFWTDAWDGYPAARKRLLQEAGRRPSADTIVVGGDIHAFAVTDLKLDFDDPKAKIMATEFCGSSIASQGPAAKDTEPLLPDNPQIHYMNGEARGYVRVALSKDKAEVCLRSIETEKQPNAAIKDLAKFQVRKARPGAEPV